MTERRVGILSLNLLLIVRMAWLNSALFRGTLRLVRSEGGVSDEHQTIVGGGISTGAGWARNGRPARVELSSTVENDTRWLILG